MSVTFIEATHAYFTEDGRELPSVTTILKRQGISADLSMVKEEVLKKKAIRGNLIHDEIDNFIKTGEMGISDEFIDFVNMVYPLAESWESEVIVNTDDYAGKADLVGHKGNKLIYVDHKSGTVNINSVTWQTNLYANAYGREGFDNEYYVFDAKPNDKDGKPTSKLVKLEEIPTEILNAMIACDKNGMVYNPASSIIASKSKGIIQMDKRIARLEAQLEKAKADRQSKYLDPLMKMMERTHRQSADVDNIHVCYTMPYSKTTVDSKTLQSKFPDAYKACLKTSTISGSVKITVKESV